MKNKFLSKFVNIDENENETDLKLNSKVSKLEKVNINNFITPTNKNINEEFIPIENFENELPNNVNVSEIILNNDNSKNKVLI